MNYCAIQRNGVASCADRKESVVCPRPRRPARLNTSFNDPSKHLRWHLGHQAELSDARPGSELLDIILSKGSDGVDRLSTQVPLSPPFFSGSPPSRVSNPLVQDARFREEKQLIPPISPLSSLPFSKSPGSASPSTSSSRKGGCMSMRANFGNNPSVRIEGFDCLERDRRNCSIPALA